MNRQDFLLGACMYALIIAAGLSGPILKKLSKLPWDRPAGKIVQDLSQASSPAAGQKAEKALMASKVRQILAPVNSAPTPDLSLEAIRRKLEENWKGMASRPSVLGPGTDPSQNASSFIGKKTGLKLTPVAQKRKVIPEGEITKG